MVRIRLLRTPEPPSPRAIFAFRDADRALRIAHRITEFVQIRDECFSRAAIDLAAGGGFAGAVETSSGIENDSMRAETLLRIAIRSSENGDRERARTIAGKTSFLTREWDPLIFPRSDFDFERPETWGQVYELCVSAGSCSAAFERARGLASAAVGLPAALQTTNWSALPKAFSAVGDDVLYAVAFLHAESGTAIGAMSRARELQSPAKIAWALTGIADGILENQGRLLERDPR